MFIGTSFKYSSEQTSCNISLRYYKIDNAVQFNFWVAHFDRFHIFMVDMSFSGTSKGFINYIYDRYKNLKIKDISLVFEGQITHQVMKALTGLVEEQLDDVEDDRVLRRVYHVMVESLQNINRHAKPMNTGDTLTLVWVWCWWQKTVNGSR